MAVVGVETKNDPQAKDLFENIIHRSKDDNLVRNPFNIISKFRTIDFESKLFFIMDITPVYPPVFWFGYPLLFIYLVFEWFNWFLILPITLMSIGFFWSSTFYALMLRVSLHKNGYRGKTKFLSNKAIIERLILWLK